MLNELIENIVWRYGGDDNVVNRIMLHDNKTYFTWAVREYVDKENVSDYLFALSEILGISISKLRYAYFSAVITPHSELTKLREYETVSKTLLLISNTPALWLSMEKYCYRQLKRLCIEELVSRGENVAVIMDMLNSSNGLVYQVRSSYIKRELSKLIQRTND